MSLLERNPMIVHKDMFSPLLVYKTEEKVNFPDDSLDTEFRFLKTESSEKKTILSNIKADNFVESKLNEYKANTSSFKELLNDCVLSQKLVFESLKEKKTNAVKDNLIDSICHYKKSFLVRKRSRLEDFIASKYIY